MLLGGLILTRLHWRSDLPPCSRRTRYLEVALHPEAYATNAPIGAIRTLNLAGALLLAGAVLGVVYEVLQSMSRP